MIKVPKDSKAHGFKIRVYTEDTDLMGIVYHSNYLCFYERARTELLRGSGLSLTTMASYDTYFAIHDIHIKYLLPARLDDVLLIKTTWEQKKSCSLIFKQTMHNQHEQCVSEAVVHVVCVNTALKPKALPKEYFKLALQ